MTFYTCAGTRKVILDVVSQIDSNLFIKGFKGLVRRRGCLSVMISDNGRNSVLNETV